MKDVKIKTTTTEVKTKTREIKCNWSPELLSNLKSFHNVDASAELVKLLNSEIKSTIRKKKIENILKHID